METPERPASSFPSLPKNERSKLRKKIIYNVDDWKEPNSFSPKKAFFFISSSSSEDELTNYAAAPPPSKQRIHTPYPHSDSDNSLPGLVTPKPSPPPDFFSRPSSPLVNTQTEETNTLTSDLPTLPQRFSNSINITLKPQPRKPFIDDNHETVYKTTSTTRRLTTPTAIITSHRQTRTKTIIHHIQ